MDVSVVIPTRNGGPRFGQVLRAIQEQTTTLRHEIVVADSASTDGTAERAAESGARVLPIDPDSFNHGATRDAAIAGALGEYVVLLVQDAVPAHPEWLERLVQPLIDQPDVAGAFSRQVPVPGGNPILDERLRGWIAGQEASRTVRLGERDWDSLTPMERLDLVAFDNVASCLRKRCWHQRPFGERPFGEDLSWSTWAIRQGQALSFAADSVVEHSHDRSAWYEARRIYCDHRNLHQLLGLRTIRRLGDAWRGSRAAREHYREVLNRAALPPAEHRRRWRWARHYALGEALAQWLAPRVNDAGERGFYGFLDRRLRRGI